MSTENLMVEKAANTTVAPADGQGPSDPAPVNEHDELRRALQRAEQRYDLLVRHTPDLVYALDPSGVILEINPAVAAFGYVPEELIGRAFGDLIHSDDRKRVMGSCYDMVARNQDCSLARQFRMITPSDEVRWLEDNCVVRFDSQGEFLLLEGICKDISSNIPDRSNMLAAGGGLDEQMRIRAVELMFANEELQKEIRQLRETERVLRKREADLELDMSTLQAANTALKVLFKRRDSDKHAFEDQVMFNVKELLLPYLDKLRAVAVDERQKAYLSILESNLNEITAPFFRRLSIEYFDLTTAELKVANFIRQGKRSQDIATLLGLSIRTIEAYRLSIRRKMRLQKRKINLRTFLQTIR